MTRHRRKILMTWYRRLSLRLGAAGLVALIAAIVAPAVAAPDVTAVRLGEREVGTRFVIDISEGVEYRIFTLSNPYRVVIDLPRVEWRLRSDAPASGKGVVETFRFGLFTPETTRIVLDVSGPVKVRRDFVLRPNDTTPHHRVVVDLERIGEEEFRAIQRQRKPSSPPEIANVPTPSPAPAPPGKRIVVIDPGHGGVDPGAVGHDGTQEKHVTLAAARVLRDTLNATGRYDARLTRDGDFYIPLRERFAIARRADASLFLSLHADAHRKSSVRGASVYTLSETASDAEAAALAAKENRSDVIAGVDLSTEEDEVADILIDLAQRETMNLSASFARLLVDALGERVTLLRNTHRFAGFAVLKAPDVPSVLVELGYLTNRTDERQLGSTEHLRTISRAIRDAIDEYFAERERLSKS